MLHRFIPVFVVVFVCGVLAEQRDLGWPNWKCDESVYERSELVPTNVNAVKFADINVIAAVGDSLTAANGAGAPRGDPLAVILQYRGSAFQIGGQYPLEQHITITSILKKFNDNLFGYSSGIGTANVWEISKLNQAIPGAISHDMSEQARAVVQLMKSHPQVDVQNDWKLVNMFIGANDMCEYCKEKENGSYSKAHFKQNLIDAVTILRDHLPRTIVSMTGMFDMGMLRSIDKDRYFCEGLHVFECHCEKQAAFTNDDISAACHLYMDAQQEIIDSGMFDTDDFTLVLQPFLNGIKTPPLKPDGEVDIEWFAPDCFHFSNLGHANVAKHLWNNIVQPVGAKSHSVNLSDPTIPLMCPDPKCPFFRTVQNSKDCTKYFH